MRYQKIDGIRGILLISMIGYHICWDLVNLAGVSIPGYTDWPGFLWQQSICWGFILISGFCAYLSRNRFQRGLIVFLCGAFVTVLTTLFIPEDRVVFGILTFLGSAMLLTNLLRKYIQTMPPIVGMIVFSILFYLFYPLNQGYLQCAGIRIRLPDRLYSNYFSTFLGFMQSNFFSTDYYSILPWFFLFLIGFETGALLKDSTMLSILKKGFLPPVEWAGRHALPLYLLHQPLIYLFLMMLR